MVVVVVDVKFDRESELLAPGQTRGLLRRRPGFGQRRQQHAGENCDDRDYYQQFYQCKKFHPVLHFSFLSFGCYD
ncbi:hypothetical protein SDC9_199041 [bioreactor metagenome]|uniref:Uncharacterized protein n=1 Tax=bioreactor metagenome TaxID=1076179 RepID=A0A645IK63_9ZZZZ